ncbi:MAG: ATP-binding protein, partial [Pseudomonadota bacterium]
MTETATVEKHAFQTEVQQLLQLMIHSLYSNKEIFLRELISNASDACDKLSFTSLTDKSVMEGGEPNGIWVDFNEKKKTISIRDNGIGMTKDEVIANIGTIARSGTKAFLEQMNQDKSSAGYDAQ